MRAYEFQTDYTEDGIIRIPVQITKKLKKKQKIKLIIMTQEKEDIEAKLKTVDDLSHLLDDLEEDEKQEFDKIVNKRANLKRKKSEL